MTTDPRVEAAARALADGWSDICVFDAYALARLALAAADAADPHREQLVREIAAWLRHADRLDEIAGARAALPERNPLWDVSFALEDRFLRGGTPDE